MLCFPAHCCLVNSCSESIGCVLRWVLNYFVSRRICCMPWVWAGRCYKTKAVSLTTQQHRHHVPKEEGLWLGRLQVQGLETRVQPFLLPRLIQEQSPFLYHCKVLDWAPVPAACTPQCVGKNPGPVSLAQPLPIAVMLQLKYVKLNRIKTSSFKKEENSVWWTFGLPFSEVLGLLWDVFSNFYTQGWRLEA